MLGNPSPGLSNDGFNLKPGFLHKRDGVFYYGVQGQLREGTVGNFNTRFPVVK